MQFVSFGEKCGELAGTCGHMFRYFVIKLRFAAPYGHTFRYHLKFIAKSPFFQQIKELMSARLSNRDTFRKIKELMSAYIKERKVYFLYFIC